ncbi:hypothetical protein HYH03_000404 [Edaphochlamys debaryana]|uniref:DOMON domain-containing protein n=1 Tax=Edaphochlamys debaryana TaxID=47281 RepID=A0A835YJ52_9CHLO|nr:hypothetical protein HYH03_000404 [Edaphochlamys debaryana]|eukprot:KAG2501906.1 hypothetical protein HYH03_000404 [Edaphochlamys debaryana]
MARPGTLTSERFLSLIVLALGVFAPAARAASCYKYVSQKNYPACIQLEPGLVLHWRTTNADDDANTPLIEFVADADGYLNWLAIGVSEAGFKGVDYNVAIQSGATWIMGDFFTLDGVTLIDDQDQDAALVTQPNFDNDNHTLAVWTRPMDSCDLEDVAIFANSERSIVWTYGYNTDWSNDKLVFGTFKKGIVTGVKLFNTATPIPGSPQTQINLTMPAYPVPTSNFSVTCVNLPLPADAPYHVISYQGFNTTNNVHHIAGYVCGAGVVPMFGGIGQPYPCAGIQPTLPNLLPPGCETLNYVWSPGAGRFTAPAEAGFAIGAGSAAYMVLQVHYWNLQGAVGKTDSSGLTLTYTPTLRNNTLGVLTVGSNDIKVPTNTDLYSPRPNFCPGSCTGRRVLQPVTLVSNFYMMNSLGASILVRHIRDGKAMQPLGRINYYDFTRPSFQGVFPDSKQLRANDSLISVCSYSSNNITKTPTGGNVFTYGLAPWQEMCFNFVTFYPVSAMPGLDYCVSDFKNLTTCATRTQLAAQAAANATDAMMVQNGTKLAVGSVNVSYYRSDKCQLYDQSSMAPVRKPNTGAAVASIVLVPTVLLTIGYIIYSKYSKQEELEALLKEARERGLDPEDVLLARS